LGDQLGGGQGDVDRDKADIPYHNRSRRRQADHYGLWGSNGTPWLINLAVTGVAAWYGFGWAEGVGATVAAPAENQIWLDIGWAALVGLGLTLACHIPITFWRNLSYKRGIRSQGWNAL
jgi:hypothetical protein